MPLYIGVAHFEQLALAGFHRRTTAVRCFMDVPQWLYPGSLKGHAFRRAAWDGYEPGFSR
jgi:hypothetical protein